MDAAAGTGAKKRTVRREQGQGRSPHRHRGNRAGVGGNTVSGTGQAEVPLQNLRGAVRLGHPVEEAVGRPGTQIADPVRTG